MLRIAFLWHLHQPFYGDSLTGEVLLPWVRLHATKDYYGMAALAAEQPTLSLTFNLVPSLLVQLLDFTSGRVEDRSLAMARKPAEDLDEADAAFLCRHFFRCHRPTIIDPHPRYRELYFAHAAQTCAGRAGRPSTTDLRDLQVWANLAWFHRTLLTSDPLLGELLAKGRDFTEEEKGALLDRQREVASGVLPLYKALQDDGRVEISTSPYAHPILPLLCRMDCAREMPRVRLPAPQEGGAQDAKEHLLRARSLHCEIFGREPAGLWPSEGAVSEEVLALAAQTGFRWVASDEGILERSLHLSFSQGQEPGWEAGLYSPYRTGAGGDALGLFFRDREISDLIGFTYQGFLPEIAAEDLVSRLLRIEGRLRKGTPVVCVILDGENPWEAYPEGGVPFLRRLYQRLAEEPKLQTVTFSEAWAETEAPPRLPRVAAGSWINADFGVWVGSPKDNQAWDYLGQTRDHLRTRDPTGVNKEASEALLRAEGSDWFWWYGDLFSSEEDDAFDFLFRRNLAAVYQALGDPVPSFLHETLCSSGREDYTQPGGFMQPTLDGEAANYMEWCAAGVYRPGRGGVMARAEAGVVRELRFGFNRTDFFLRLDTEGQASQRIAGGFRVVFPKARRVLLWPGPDQSAVLERADGPAEPYTSVCVASVAEMAIPFARLDAPPGQDLTFAVELPGPPFERHPVDGYFVIPVPTEHYEAENWSA
jgi:alpha-amylase/alpha-mannosidase (GH57 family)